MPKIGTWLRPFAQLLQAIVMYLGGTRPRVFICYRRHGAASGYGGRIAERLIAHFGPETCFRDIDSLESGVDFMRAIADAIRGCKAMIVVIGSDWLTQKTLQGRRKLEEPADFVRNELCAALRAEMRIIPVLVGGAQMPLAEQLPDPLTALARRQAHELSETRWDYDMGKLIATLESLGIPSRQKVWLPRLGRHGLQATLAAATVVALLAVSATALYVASLRRDPPPSVPLVLPVLLQPDAGHAGRYD
jgi:hypothetical protein